MSKKPQLKDENLPWLSQKLLWLENATNVKRLVFSFTGLCALLFLADLFYKKKTYFDAEKLPGMYAVYGFLTCAALVIIALGLKAMLKRGETFYAPEDVDSEVHPEHDLQQVSHND